MLCGALQTKERRIMIALLALILLVLGIITYYTFELRNNYKEQAVMADEYLEAGNYEQAIEAYLKAMSMKNSKRELLSIGLAEAYCGTNNYDKALESLRNSYQQNGGVEIKKKIKEKIEEVTAKKTDYEFRLMITNADTYYLNSEFEKAINEYEKAKLIKSKETISYERIAEAYIAMGNYSLAREEVLDGLALTQNEELNVMLDKVNLKLFQTQYEEIVKAASEYIYQENYEEAIKKLEEAINLLSGEESAYNKLAEVYITIGEYEKAEELLERALQNIQSDVMEEILDQAISLKEERDERNRILKELYAATRPIDTDKIEELLENTFFTMKIIGTDPIYYSKEGEGSISTGNIMIIMDKDNFYAGGIVDGAKKGIGIYYRKLDIKEQQIYYYYEGEWNHDMPNGIGKTEKVTIILDYEGKSFIKKVVTSGEYINGMENGLMHKIVYIDGQLAGNVSYKAVYGTPEAYKDEEGNTVSATKAGEYVIGKWHLKDKPTNDYYSIKQDTLLGVEVYNK